MAATTQQVVFLMQGARAAIGDGLLHIEEQVKALEQAVGENTGLAFDLAKTLVESACKTILKERGKTFDKIDEMGDVFKAVTLAVPFLPPAIAGEAGARKSLEQTLGGLRTALQGVCELRNACGFASHGNDGSRPAMERVQALLAAQAADAILGFLYCVHAADFARQATPRLCFEDNPEFNEWIDQQNGMVQISALPPYRPSEVLFSVDQDAYHDLLTAYQSELDEGATGEDLTETNS